MDQVGYLGPASQVGGLSDFSYTASAKSEITRLGHIEEQLGSLTAACDELDKAWMALARPVEISDGGRLTSTPAYDTFESIYQQLAAQAARVRSIANQIAMRV